MHLFVFEPGDGVSYRVLFGRLVAPAPMVAFYTIFGFAEYGDALITVVFDTEQISHSVFIKRWKTAEHVNTVGDSRYIRDAAWKTLNALVGDKSGDIAADLGWRSDWRKQLPTAAMG
ncbi:MAG TPA: hypothetical protein PKK15_04735 [Kouleothrix sp.]|nr:hypothetical protein [Kouleothrix sp.]